VSTEDDDEGGVVIPWPGKPRPANEAPPGDGDAFDDAVRRALDARTPGGIGLDAGQPASAGGGDEAAPVSAEELVARVYSAMSGTSEDAARAAVRAQSGGDVIDMQAAREARQKVAGARPELGQTLAEAFRGFVKELAHREGRSEVVLDRAFFRDHGTALLGNLFKGLAGAMTQPPRPPDAGSMTEGSAARPGPSARPPGEPGVPDDAGAPTTHEVRIRVDLGSLLKSLFTRPSAPAPETEPPAPEGDRGE